jgi:hypothetical protein
MTNRKNIVLIGCTATKHRQAMPADKLYAASPLFRKRLTWAKRLQPDSIRILSARYGLLNPAKRIEPYEQTLTRMSAKARRAWGEDVYRRLARLADPERDTFTVLAGADYVRPLAPHITHLHAPLAGLPIGRQLQALDLLNAWAPESACALIHEVCRLLPNYPVPPSPEAIPANGIYILFERGETGHGDGRIVRIGTHRGDGQLPGRISEHFSAANRHRSIFRKHIGRALLNQRGEQALLAEWDIDLTTRASRQRHESKLDHTGLQAMEEEVTRHMHERFRIAFLPVEDKERRLHLEAALIGTISQCDRCGASQTWLGRHSPKPPVRRSGLWQTQALTAAPITAADYDELVLTAMGANSARPRDSSRGTSPTKTTRPKHSAYAPLTKYLEDQSQSELTLSLRDIETILGRPLPKSAYRHRPWWANGRGENAHSQARGWQAAGYQVARVDLSSKRPFVCFAYTD